MTEEIPRGDCSSAKNFRKIAMYIFTYPFDCYCEAVFKTGYLTIKNAIRDEDDTFYHLSF
jgi:hypothetical protein